MKKVLLILIIALFTLTSVNKNIELKDYVDFDDDVYVEIVKI
ncbi:MAG: hypothetical protein ACVCEJ_00375 [Candidatus Izemoplasmataceae bacterium]